MNEPLVSVLMTAYNREKFISEAIESVLVSTYKNIELIIVDDCSVDDTVKIAQSYALIDTRIRLIVNEINLGDYPNRNKALSLSKGEYCMFVDSDDKILINGIQNCVKQMKLFPEAAFGIFSTKMSNIKLLNSNEAFQLHFFNQPFLIVGPGGTIQKTDFAKRIGGYPVKYGPANDMYYHLKVACHTPIVLLHFDFIYYRRHDGQEINNHYSYLYNNYNYLQDALTELPMPLSSNEKKWIEKKNKRRFLTNILRFYLRTLNLKKTLGAIHEAKFSLKSALEGIFQI